MCGYVRRHIGPETLREFLELLGYQGYYDEPEQEPVMKHFYPAFGGDPNRTIDHLIIEEEGELKLVNATWWYDCHEIDGRFSVGKKTTFNARNLELPYWRDAVSSRRAIVIASGIGEGKEINGKNKHFLVESKGLMFLGAVYKKFPSGRYSCAIITRDEHFRFAPYHDKAFPLFLPFDIEFLRLWLSKVDDSNPPIRKVLSSPRIFSDLHVTPVKTLKGGLATGPTKFLRADRKLIIFGGRMNQIETTQFLLGSIGDMVNGEYHEPKLGDQNLVISWRNHLRTKVNTTVNIDPNLSAYFSALEDDDKYDRAFELLEDFVVLKARQQKEDETWLISTEILEMKLAENRG